MNRFITRLYSYLDFNRYPGRYDARERHTITTMFLLGGLYCIVAVSLLLFFGAQALVLGDSDYGYMLLACAGITVTSYGLLWLLGLYNWSSYLVVGLMSGFCLILFYTGGEDTTGPIWYLVYPVLALFCLGARRGLIAAGILMLLTVLLATSVFSTTVITQYSPVLLQRLLAAYIAITILAYLFACFRDQGEAQLKAINEQLETLSNTDMLSGLLNRRGIEECIEYQIQTYSRYQIPFSMVLFDINGFKGINDTYGHVFGDYVIQTIGQQFLNSLRKIDSACRWGGDEFLLLLPGTGAAAAEIMAARLQQTIQDTTFALEGQRTQVDTSYGISEYKGGGSVDKVIRVADEALYQAKQQPRPKTGQQTGQKDSSTAD